MCVCVCAYAHLCVAMRVRVYTRTCVPPRESRHERDPCPGMSIKHVCHAQTHLDGEVIHSPPRPRSSGIMT